MNDIAIVRPHDREADLRDALHQICIQVTFMEDLVHAGHVLRIGPYATPGDHRLMLAKGLSQRIEALVRNAEVVEAEDV